MQKEKPLTKYRQGILAMVDYYRNRGRRLGYTDIIKTLTPQGGKDIFFVYDAAVTLIVDGTLTYCSHFGFARLDEA